MPFIPITAGTDQLTDTVCTEPLTKGFWFILFSEIFSPSYLDFSRGHVKSLNKVRCINKTKGPNQLNFNGLIVGRFTFSIWLPETVQTCIAQQVSPDENKFSSSLMHWSASQLHSNYLFVKLLSNHNELEAFMDEQRASYYKQENWLLMNQIIYLILWWPKRTYKFECKGLAFFSLCVYLFIYHLFFLLSIYLFLLACLFVGLSVRLSITCLTLLIRVPRCTLTQVTIDLINAGTSVLTGITYTLVNIWEKKQTKRHQADKTKPKKPQKEWLRQQQ